MNQKRIVIAGGGFGGMYTYARLHKYFHGCVNAPQITIISKHNYFLFTPLLHEVATGSLNESSIVQPIRQALVCCQHTVITGEIKRVNAARRVVETEGREIPYDYLVLALGSVTDYQNFSPEIVYTLKSIEDARKLKNAIIDCFDQAERTIDPQERRRLLTFAIIGGGPTGVELAAEIADFACRTLLKSYPAIRQEEVKVLLLQNKDTLMSQFDPVLGRKAFDILKRKKCLEIVLNCCVTSIDAHGIHLDNGAEIPTATPILVGGVKAPMLTVEPGLVRNKKDQVTVDEFLRVPSHPDIFVIGDMADISHQSTPQTAQAAEAEAALTTRNLIANVQRKPLKKFIFKEKGQLASLGRGQAVAKLFGFKFSGHFAWWLWRTIYATKLIGWPKRIRVVLDWTIDLFYPRDISRL